MGALFAKWDSLNGDLYFQDYICIQLQMIWRSRGGEDRGVAVEVVEWRSGVGRGRRQGGGPFQYSSSVYE